MSKIIIEWEQYERLLKAMQEYGGNVEKTVNDVLHNEAGQLIQDAVKILMPRSFRNPWSGEKSKKAPPAKTSNSLMIVKDKNLSVTVKTRTAYNYLYFPDDGSNTRRHVGNQRFFERGGVSQSEEIINRCISRLIGDFENVTS